MSQLYKTFLKPLFTVVVKDVQFLLNDLDPVKDVPLEAFNRVSLLKIGQLKPKHGELNSHYLFPFFFTVFITVDCLAILYKYSFHYSYTGMPDFFSLNFPIRVLATR